MVLHDTRSCPSRCLGKKTPKQSNPHSPRLSTHCRASSSPGALGATQPHFHPRFDSPSVSGFSRVLHRRNSSVLPLPTPVFRREDLDTKVVPGRSPSRGSLHLLSTPEDLCSAPSLLFSGPDNPDAPDLWVRESRPPPPLGGIRDLPLFTPPKEGLGVSNSSSETPSPRGQNPLW